MTLSRLDRRFDRAERAYVRAFRERPPWNPWWCVSPVAATALMEAAVRRAYPLERDECHRAERAPVEGIDYPHGAVL